MKNKDEQTKMSDLWTKADEYSRAYQQDEQIGTVLDLLELSPATGLIDLGCGNGAFAVEAARRHPECRVWACDVLPGAVDEWPSPRRRGAGGQCGNRHLLG